MNCATNNVHCCPFPSTGPCVSTDTACSSSLVATHLAHVALERAECGSAVAAGANLMLLAGTTAAICQLRALSPVGRCKSFEASADGYGRGEGVAALVLCRQQPDLLARLPTSSGSHVVLRGSAVNQGGRSSGLTAPNGPAQAALVREALASGGVAPFQLGVISVHGTGTPLGDPIEVGALAQALASTALNGSSGSNSHGGVTIMSNKAAFGHTEGTAGIAGLLLAAAALDSQAAAPVLHLRAINPYVEASLSDWGRSQGSFGARPLRQLAPALLHSPVTGRGGEQQLAGTSSFGMSGVNAHMVVGRADTSASQAMVQVSREVFGWNVRPIFC